MDEQLKNQIKAIANTIRGLSIDAIEKANSGHPGICMGCAEIAAYLYGLALNFNPKNPKWINRDRFVLSAGHGSMLLYSSLHLAGFDLSLDDIKNFRQLDSKTPGHPEHHTTDGVEVLSGPLGKGVGNSVGMALGMKILASKFNTDEFEIINNKVFCLCGDGDLMEGVSSEASSLAGHWRLNNLVLIYDANNITLDGPLSECSSEDTKSRYRSYGFDVYEIDGNDLDAIHSVISEVKENQEKPVFILAHTIIGKGSPHKAGSHKSHGSPLGEEEVLATKEAIKISKKDFYVSTNVKEYFEERRKKQTNNEYNWDEIFRKWSKSNPDLLKEFNLMKNKKISKDLEENLKILKIKSPIASRKSSQEVINSIVSNYPFIYGGSADLSSSDMTYLKKYSFISFDDFRGRNIKFGVREFAMGTICNGLSLLDMFLPYCGTFLVFSDYMRASIRKSALSNLQVIYQFTHDSVFLGEDGPSHQPVEQIASLRAMPNLQVIRPSDSNEVKMAWIAALNHNGPTALILSRQSLQELECTKIAYKDGLSKGAYIVREERQKSEFTLFATGSELLLALDVAKELNRIGKDVRVVSFPSFEIFEKQSEDYKNKIVGGDIGRRVSIEAATDFGWHKYIGREGISICIDTFGISAPQQDIANRFGFTVEAVMQHILAS